MRVYGFWVLICAVLWSITSAAEKAVATETNMNQGVEITDLRMRRGLKEIIEDYGRATPSAKGEAQVLQACLREDSKPLVLTRGEHAQAVSLLKAYREQPDALHIGKVERLLVRLGDTESITNAVRKISQGPIMQRMMTPGMLARSKQPAVVTALAPDLKRDESIRHRLIGGEFRLEPRSVAAMYAINQILAESAQFPADVNTWARSLRTIKVVKRRELLRSWWNANRDAMLSARYADTRPLSEAEQDLHPSDLEPQRRPVRRIE